MNLSFNLRFHYLIKLTFFWFVFFLFFRLLFIIYHFPILPEKQFLELFKAIFKGWRLDLSIISYLLLFPFIFWSLQQFFKNRKLHLLNKGYHILLIIVLSVLSIANIRMYGEWGTLLNYRALGYLLYPKEVIASLSTFSLVLLVALCIVISALALLFYRVLTINFSYVYEVKAKRFLLVVVFFVLLGIGARGGLQQIPINESAAYYSRYTIHNHIATNNIWYLAHSFLDANEGKNPYQFMDQSAAEARVKKLHQSSSLISEKFLNTNKFNIIFIVLESWSADLIKKSGADENTTPQFDALASEGLLFTNAYSSGYRTDQGLASIFSGFPAQPNVSIITVPSKAEKLKSLNQHFVKKGYSSSFYYGGEIGFANIKTYLVNSGFQKIVDINDFQSEQLNSKWGAHDEYVFEKQMNDLKNQKEPFFSVVLTLSTHEPFEVPISSLPFKGKTESEKFKNAAYYTDQCLGNYFRKAKKQNWYSNTLFILVADHGHSLPKARDMNMPESRKIAMLFCGGALKNEYKGKTVDKIVAQHDLPAIVLGQIDEDYKMFNWSKNVFNSDAGHYAYYSNENVLGWITSKGNVVYSYASKNLIVDQAGSLVRDSILSDAQSYLQAVYQDYLDK